MFWLSIAKSQFTYSFNKPRNAIEKAALYRVASNVELQTTGKTLINFNNISLVTGSLKSLVFGVKRFIPSNIFLTTNFWVLSSKLFNLQKKLMPAK